MNALNRLSPRSSTSFIAAADTTPTAQPVVARATDTTERVSGRTSLTTLARWTSTLVMAGALVACGGADRGAGAAATGAKAAVPTTTVTCPVDQLEAAKKPVADALAAAQAQVATLKQELATAGEKAETAESALAEGQESLAAGQARVAEQQRLIDGAVDKTLAAGGAYNARPRLKALQAQLAKMSEDDRAALNERIAGVAGKYSFALQPFDVAAANAASAAKPDDDAPATGVMFETIASDDVLGELVTRGRVYVGFNGEAPDGKAVIEKTSAIELTSIEDLRSFVQAFK